MQISTKFTIAIHIIAAADYFGGDTKVTSDLLASSIGSNPVIIRNIMSDLSAAGIIETRRGPGGIVIKKPLEAISFYDIYEAVEKNKDQLFNFHDNPNPPALLAVISIRHSMTNWPRRRRILRMT